MPDDSVPWGALDAFPRLLARPPENKYNILERYIHSCFLLTIAIIYIMCTGKKIFPYYSYNTGLKSWGFFSPYDVMEFCFQM